MYEPHPCFDPPSDPDARIWRYMDFAKYVSLLDKHALYFARAHQLEDQFEGSFTTPTLGMIEEAVAVLPPEVREASRAEYTKTAEMGRRDFAVNSWHMSNHESAAMWKLYLGGTEGVTIQSSYSRLVDSFAPSSLEVMIGKGNYVDYGSHSFRLDNAFWSWLHKRDSFEYEREIRAVVWEPRYEVWRGAQRGISTGVLVEADLEVLIENVVVSPGSGAWFRELVQSVSRRYGIDRTPMPSALDSKPIF
jgi:hypothetical protein